MLPNDEYESPLSRILNAVTAPLRKVASAVGYVAWTCERGIAYLVGFVLSGTERVDRIGDVLHGAWRLLFWPFFAAGRLLSKAWQWLTPPAVRRALAAPANGVLRLWHWSLQSFAVVAEKLALDRFLWILIWALQPLWRPVASVVNFIIAWAQSREYRAMLWAVPALAIVVPLGAALSHGLVRGQSKTAEAYRRMARDARDAQDYTMLRFYERKLSQLDVENEAASFRMAAGFAEQDDMATAVERMRELAPEEEPGYPRAHLWFIQHLVDRTIELPPDERLRQLRIHLDHASELGVESPYLSIVDALCLVETGELKAAAEVLRPLVDEEPAAAIQRLLINVELQSWDDARSDAATVRRHMQLVAGESKPLAARQYQTWALAEQLLGDTQRLRSVVDQWHAQFPEDDQARARLATLVHDQFNRRFQAASQSGQGLLGELARANVGPLVDRFLRTHELAGDESDELNAQLRRICLLASESEAANEFVTALGADKRTPAVFLETIGAHAIQSDDWLTGKTLLEKAVQRDPQNALAWNNFAWVLAHDSQPDLLAALSAANQALSLAGDVARFRETRGQIYLQLERWPEAVVDLEIAANGMPESTDVHRSLAEAYQALGNEELARIHLDFLK